METVLTSAWQQGATAARTGVAITACPYPFTEYDFVTWTHGWVFATHTMAVSLNSDLF